MPEQQTLLVRKDRLSETDLQSSSAPNETNLGQGQALMEISHFSFTSNNITYAAMGDRMDYWSFFPAGEPWGIVPVWGFANVVASRCEGIGVGDRYYGYYPMSTHLVVEPTRVRDGSFVDGASHRKHLSLIYNQYLNVRQDSLYTPESEDLQMLLRPLFTTSFLLDDFFFDNDFFGASQLILTSASSKTALGMAFLLAHNRSGRSQDYEVLGLTSAGNRSFVESLGCYDRVLSYDEVGQIDPSRPSAIVDFAGNGLVLGELHRHLSTELRYSCMVGLSHWDQRGGLPKELPGPRPELFFAPSQAEKRLAEWGGRRLQEEVTRVWQAFLGFTSDKVEVRHESGPQAAVDVYRTMLSGQFDPRTGYILTMQSPHPA